MGGPDNPRAKANTNPVTVLKVAARNDAPRPASTSGGGGNDDMSEMEERFRKVERTVDKLEGAFDWAKIAVGILVTAMVAGFSLLAVLSFNTLSKVEGISSKLADEFRAQRQEQSAQTSAIANAITATKQQAPQVILLPTPASDPKAKQP